jgi:shikimate dehydrogenase
VLGWPVAHSLSPAIHNAALRACGLDRWHYQLLPVDPELLHEVVVALPGAGFRGANVTIPHKRAVLELATGATARARAIGAANTLTFEAGGEIVADNTDAPAFTEAVPIGLRGTTALVLGAGGTARATVWALADAGASEIRVWNRTPSRAEELCRLFGATAVTAPEPADLLINCTAVGLDGSHALETLPVSARAVSDFGCVVDFVYAASETALIRAARAAGRPAVDGLDLLVGQGALSFERFTGLRAPVDVMRDAARGERPRAQTGG